MARQIIGPIEYPNGTVIALATLKFRAIDNNYSADGSTPIYTEITVETTTLGNLDTFFLNNGTYRVYLQEAGETNWLTLGTIVVETGSQIALGSLIDTSDTSNVLTYADVATQTWVAAYVLGGGAPGDIDITDLGIGTAAAYESIEINAAGTAIIGTRHLGLSFCFSR